MSALKLNPFLIFEKLFNLVPRIKTEKLLPTLFIKEFDSFINDMRDCHISNYMSREIKHNR